MATSRLKSVLLNNGHLMPRLGIGTFQMLGEKCQEIVTRAIELGYRHVDTAYSYMNEKDVGAALNYCVQRGLVKRGDVFITTKIPPVYLDPKDAKWCVEESLENLKTPYLDLVLLHNPWGLVNKGDGNMKPVGKDGFHYEYKVYNMTATWAAVEECVRSGKTRSIGVSNFKESLIRNILNTCTIRPQNVQLECHAYYQQKQLRDLCFHSGVSCTGYSPLGSPGRPPNQITDENKVDSLLENEIVTDIAGKYGKSSAQILIRFLMQENLVVIPKTSNLERLEENMNVFDFEISETDMHVLRSLDKGLRYFVFSQYKNHPEFPKRGEPF